MLPQNTRESAVRREEFHQLLKAWLDESFDERVGDPDSHAGLAWLWVRHGGDHFYLNADSTREGVRRYLHVVEASDGDPGWATQSSRSGGSERVTVGRGHEGIDGFEFYRYISAR